MSIAQIVIESFLDRKLAQPHTPRTCPKDRSLVKGVLAGVAAGLAATAAKTLVERVYPPRIPPRTPAELKPAHWAFGAAAGAAYGALAEFYPAASSHDGVNFGMTVMALTHDSALSTANLALPAAQTSREKSSELASHIVFGLAAETTRRVTRKLL